MQARWVLAWCLLLTGCGAPSGGNPASPTSTAPATTLHADEGITGRIVAVNPTLRYVVMDFALRQVPAVDQRLQVYREGRKVGEIKVTGPARDTTIAGDIMGGNAQVGDEVSND
jgi:hypothetical protein